MIIKSFFSFSARKMLENRNQQQFYLLSRVDIVICYIEVDFTFEPLEYVCYIEEFVISRFYSIHLILP